MARWSRAGTTASSRPTTRPWPSTAVLRASDEDLWPELTGFTLPDIRAFAQFRSSFKGFDLLAARRARRPDARHRDDGAPAPGQRAQCGSHRGRPPGPPAARRGDGHRRGHERAGTSGRASRAQHHRRRAPRPGRRPRLADLCAEGRVRGHAGREHPPPRRSRSGRTACASCAPRSHGRPRQPPTASSPSRHRGRRSTSRTSARSSCACRPTSPMATTTTKRSLGCRARPRERRPPRRPWSRFLIAVRSHVASGRLVACTELLLAPDAAGAGLADADGGAPRAPGSPSRPGRQAGQPRACWCGGLPPCASSSPTTPG